MMMNAAAAADDDYYCLAVPGVVTVTVTVTVTGIERCWMEMLVLVDEVRVILLWSVCWMMCCHLMLDDVVVVVEVVH